MAFQPRADLQNQAIGWLQREYSYLDGWYGGMISANLEVIWVMSVQTGTNRSDVDHAICCR